MAGRFSAAVPQPSFLVDEMLGRLARYLRFVGCDAEYVRDVDDAEILTRARSEGRIILTRDRILARSAPHALLLTQLGIAEQWREVRRAFPALNTRVQFDRCTECNGVLSEWHPPASEAQTPGVPWDRVAQGLLLYRCERCAHLYWEGSHTAHIARRLAEWEGREAA